MAGTFAMSAGILLSGLPAILQQQLGLSQIESVKPLFMLYSILGIIVIAIYFMLSKKIELTTGEIAKQLTKVLSPETKKIVGKLSRLFSIDSFA